MGAFAEFLATRRSEATVRLYRRVVPQVAGAPDEFLEFARADKRGAEERLIAWAVASRGKHTPYTVSIYLSVVRSFLQYNDVLNLNWRRVQSVVPPKRIVGNDKAPTLEEMRTGVKHAGARGRALLTVMASSGIRVGAWHWLTVADVRPMEGGVAALRVYRGEPEEYTTFISVEAAANLNEYLESRRMAGEKVEPTSPLLTGVWDTQEGRAPEVAVPLSVRSIQTDMERIWNAAGLRRREFKVCHGTRKFFETRASMGIHNIDVVRMLKGKSFPYLKPTLDELRLEYLKAQAFLLIDEKYEADTKLRTMKEEQEPKIMRLEHDYLVADRRVKDLEENQARVNELLLELRKRGVLP